MHHLPLVVIRALKVALLIFSSLLLVRLPEKTASDPSGASSSFKITGCPYFRRRIRPKKSAFLSFSTAFASSGVSRPMADALDSDRRVKEVD